MPDTKISALAALTDPDDLDELVIVDKSDTSMGASGTTKRVLLSSVNPSCKATRSTTQSINNVTYTAVAYTSESWDRGPAALHDNATDNTRITLPTAGIYLFFATVIWASNVNGTYRRFRFWVNNTYDLGTFGREGIATPTGNIPNAGNMVHGAAAGDYCEIQAYQDSGGALDVASSTFVAVRIGST